MSWIQRIFGRRRLYDDLSEEMRQHIQEKAEELVERGMSREDAMASARRHFGNVTLLQERGREVWRWPTVESVLFDIRYAIRQLRRQPTFTIVAVLILGLGIGANTAVFSIIDKLVFEPLPFRGPERLTWILNGEYRSSTVDTYEALRGLRTFEEMTTYELAIARNSYKLTGNGEPDRVSGVMVADNFFQFLGVSPLLGRTFTAEECQANGPGAVILSHALWERRYHSNPGVIGSSLVVNDKPATIVGVMPPTFDFGAVFVPGTRVEVFMPAVLDVLREYGPTMAILGRLKPDMTRSTAQTEANNLLERQKREHPEFGKNYSAVVTPLRELITGNVRRPMLTLWGAVGLVLLIVCVNLSNLLLARAVSRRKEIAVRGALGAGRGRLVQQLLTESFVLSLFGGALGVAFAYAATDYVRRLEGLSIPLLKNVEIHMGALAVAVGVTVVTAVLFGLVPALTIARGEFGTTMKESSRGSGEGNDHQGLRSVLVVSEVAFACLLLVGAGLLVRSFLNVLKVDLGFQAEHIYTLRVDSGRNIDTREKYFAYIQRLVAAARSVPGVQFASVTDAVPLEGARAWAVRPKGQPADQAVISMVKVVGPGLMETMQTRVIAGREFTDRDVDNATRVVIVNQTMATRFWSGQDPLRQTLMNGDRELQVVGVAADVRHRSIENSTGPEFYIPILQQTTSSPSLVVRTSRPFADIAPGLRAALAEVAPELPTNGFRPLQQLVDRAVSPRRFFLNLLTAFAGAALVLAAIGIYGVIAYSVARRTPEIGIRMALGASGGRIRAGVLGQTLRLTFIGAVIGITGATALSSLLSTLLFGVSAIDPMTYVAAAVILLVVAVSAGFIPAFRASCISPMTALRTD